MRSTPDIWQHSTQAYGTRFQLRLIGPRRLQIGSKTRNYILNPGRFITGQFIAGTVNTSRLITSNPLY